MLVFTRKLDEAIIIGDGVEVRVLRVGRQGVKLGITAPPKVAIHRQEIYEQIRQENRAAASASLADEAVVERLRQMLDGQPTIAPETPS